MWAKLVIGGAAGAVAAVVAWTAGARPDGGIMPPRAGLPYVAWLPAVQGRPPAPVFRPADYEGIRAAAAVAGAVVMPRPGVYKLPRPLELAPGVTLDGGGAVTFERSGIYIYRADGVTVRGVTIVGAAGDGVSVTRSGGSTIDRVTVRGWGDGGIDIVRTPPGSGRHLVRDVVLEGQQKGMLLGHQEDAGDHASNVLLVRVSFIGVVTRTPKVHRARVTIVGGLVRGWVGPRYDVQMSGHIDANGVRWEAGAKSQTGYKLLSGGTVAERGAVIVPWRGGK